MNSNKDCPCYRHNKDCVFRKKDCHATCQEFKDWRAEKDAKNKAKRNSIDREYLNYIVPKIRKRKKRKNEKSSS